MFSTYLEPLRIAYEEAANENAAFYMSKYMKNKFPYYGISSVPRKAIQSEFLKKYGFPSIDTLNNITLELWNADQREYQYFAMELVEKMMKKADNNAINLYEYMIVNRSWWDTVDLIAARIVGSHFKKFPELILPLTQEWMDSENIWLQRTCLLFQLKYKKQTDTNLLYGFIVRLANSNEFFIKKAIGWVLREYSKTNPEAVIQFVNNHYISPFSKKEAFKVIERSKKNPA